MGAIAPPRPPDSGRWPWYFWLGLRVGLCIRVGIVPCARGCSIFRGFRMPQSVVQVSGHIIDSLILPKVLDLIISLGADFEILEIQIGHRRSDLSYARVQVEAPTPELLERVLSKIKEHGALPVEEDEANVQLESAPEDGIFPDYF